MGERQETRTLREGVADDRGYRVSLAMVSREAVQKHERRGGDTKRPLERGVTRLNQHPMIYKTRETWGASQPVYVLVHCSMARDRPQMTTPLMRVSAPCSGSTLHVN